MRLFVHSDHRHSTTAVLILRLVLGIIMMAHGSQKVFGAFGGPGLSGTAGFMGSMGVPTILAYASAFTEFIGGIALILGFMTRFFAIAMLIDLLVAMLLVHLPKGFFAPAGIEMTLALSAMSLAIAVLGPGRASIDQNIFGKRYDNATTVVVNNKRP
jgi:putative oxidoreductase